MSMVAPLGRRPLTCALVLTVGWACKTEQASRLRSQKKLISRTPWQDISLSTESKKRVRCSDAKDDLVLCLFKHPVQGLIWSERSAGMPTESEDWQTARNACRSLAKVTGRTGWRLPTEKELRKVALDSDGNVNPEGLIPLGDGFSGFGGITPFSGVWTATEGENGDGSAITFYHGEERFGFETIVKDLGKSWYCVRETTPADANLPLSTKRTTSNSSAEPSVLRSKPLKDRKAVMQALRSRLTTIDAKDHLHSDGSLVIGGSGGLAFAERQTKITGDQAQARLDLILSRYAKVLRNLERQGLLARIQLIGHSSPTVGGKPVQPTNSQGFRPNLVVSFERALFVTDRLADIAPDLIPYIEVTAKSYKDPRLQPDSNTGSCGNIDCSASRRVVIHFSLSR